MTESPTYDELASIALGLARENRRLARENRKLRRSHGDHTGQERRILQAADDAQILVDLWLSGIYPSRRNETVTAIMGSRRHANALALLRLGGVMQHSRFTTRDPGTIQAALDRGKRRALRSPESWEARQPRYNQKWRRHRGM